MEEGEEEEGVVLLVVEDGGRFPSKAESLREGRTRSKMSVPVNISFGSNSSAKSSSGGFPSSPFNALWILSGGDVSETELR